MKRLLALACACGGWMASIAIVSAQPADTAAVIPPQTNNASDQSSPPPTVFRDPRTGQLIQQEFKTVDQPVTTWQRKFVDRTVVTPQTVIENQQVPQTYYVAKTEYVMQSKLKGWWNPFAQPTYAYEYVPVTRWVPQTQMVARQVPTVKMLASTEKVAIDEPVQTMQKVTQVVTKPLPANAPINNTAGVLPPGAVTTNAYAANGYAPNGYAPNGYAANAYAANAYTANAYAQRAYQPPAYQPPAYQPPVNSYASNAYAASSSQPLVASVPLFNRQPTQTFQPGTLLKAPFTGLRDIVRATTAPFTGQNAYRPGNSGYAQPVNIAAQPNAGWGRDPNQAGMPATLVR